MALDIIVIAAYLVLVIAIGLRSSKVRTIKDYFLGNRSIHWSIACFSIVATETSALTFISLPGLAYVKGLGFLQIAFGYILGRVLVAVVLLPRYFAGEVETAYHFLQNRFGVSSRRAMAVVFHVTRLFADGIRLFCTAIPFSLLLGMGDEYAVSILVIGLSSLVYAFYGGIKSVAVVDTVQLFLYMFCAFVGIYIIADILGMHPFEIIDRIPAGHLRMISSGLGSGLSGFFGTYNIFSGIIGGALLSFATHGTDHLLVQRVLSCRDLGSARKAMIVSGILVFFQFLIFLSLGLFIMVLLGNRPFAIPDQIMPFFIVEYLPHGLKGLMLAGILAVSMSTISSTINSLSSSTSLDILRLSERDMPEARKVMISRLLSFFWAAALVGVALMVRDARNPLVEVALGIASITSGATLGIFFLGSLFPSIHEKAALAGVFMGIGAVGIVFVLNLTGAVNIFWPWFVPIGFSVSLAASLAVNTVMRRLG